MKGKIVYFVNNIKKEIIFEQSVKCDDFGIDFKKDNNRYCVKITPFKTIKIDRFYLEENYAFNKNDQFFINGYQSWTTSKIYNYDEPMKLMTINLKPIIKHYHLDCYGDSLFTSYNKHELHSFSYTYILSKNETTLFGSLNEQSFYTIFYYLFKSNKIRIDIDINNFIVNKEITVCNFIILKGSRHNVIAQYLGYLPSLSHPKLTGYSSWYNYYQNINEEILKRDLTNLKNDEQMFQIDDGFETFVGDWLNVDERKFPHGLNPLFNDIRNKKLKIGLWLAPFVCECKSDIYQKHPDWLVKDENNKIILAGCNWSNFAVLDIYNQEVQEYLEKVFNHYNELGADLYKLDFLYAIGLIKRNDKSRAEIMYDGMKLLRKLIGNRYFLACGASIFSCLGLANYIRVGADVSLSYDDKLYMHILHQERPSTKNTIINTICRHELSRNIGVDGDVYILRKNNTTLSDDQKEILFTVNHLFGDVILTSDDMATYNQKSLTLYNQKSFLLNCTVADYRRVGNVYEIFYQDDAKNQYVFKFNYLKGKILK